MGANRECVMNLRVPVLVVALVATCVAAGINASRRSAFHNPTGSLSRANRSNDLPIMAKIPCIGGGYRNRAVSTEAQSLIHPIMPRIIIQEEEESKLGLTPE